MAAEYTLRYLPVAQGDLLDIFDFIAKDSSTYIIRGQTIEIHRVVHRARILDHLI